MTVYHRTVMSSSLLMQSTSTVVNFQQRENKVDTFVFNLYRPRLPVKLNINNLRTYDKVKQPIRNSFSLLTNEEQVHWA